MSGGLTTVEETLLQANDEPLVRHVRLRFQEQTKQRFRDAVEQITGRCVLSYESQILFHPTYVIEIFVLDHPVEPTGASEGRREEARSEPR